MLLIVIMAIMRMNLSAAIGKCLLPIESKYILALTKTITGGVVAFSGRYENQSECECKVRISTNNSNELSSSKLTKSMYAVHWLLYTH